MKSVKNVKRLIFVFIIISSVLYSSFVIKKEAMTICVHEIQPNQMARNILEIGDFFNIHTKQFNIHEYDKNLDVIFSFLKKHPKVTVELAVHSDYLGGVFYNDSLTRKQASYAYNYLVSKGIERNRIVAVGKGSRYPYYVYKDKVLEQSPFRNVEFNKGVLLNKDYINGIKDQNSKLAALYLNSRISITVIDKSLEE